MDMAPVASAGTARKITINWLSAAVRTWFVITAVGQWLFVFYIGGYFGSRFVANGVQGFSGTHLANGFIQGDNPGNVALAVHILLAGLIIAAGQIQLIPQLRNRIPRLHRFSGRFYMLASVIVSAAGIYLIWSRERVISSLLQDVGTSLGGVLAILFVPIALYYAVNRDFVSHRRWALRLFMVVSAVWFLRLMIFAWILITGGVGMDMKTFTGPFLNVVHFAQYLLPLALLELYFKAESKSCGVYRNVVSGVIFFASAVMFVGVIATTAFFWYPRMVS